MGRHMDRSVMRGVTAAHRMLDHGVNCSLSTNNVLNPFTPFGDCSLLRMANFYAHVAHVPPGDFERCVELVTSLPARLMNLKDYGLAVGRPANFIVVEAESASSALAEIADTAMAFRNGVQTVARAPAELLEPASRPVETVRWQGRA
jgi:cytosine deaminase